MPPAVMVSADCTRLGHPAVELAVHTGDRVTACKVCSIAYRRALELGDDRFAAAFVLALQDDDTYDPDADVEPGGVGPSG